MPQMAPLMWLNLLAATLMTLLLLAIFNYFIKTSETLVSGTKMNLNLKNMWQW